MCDWLCKSFLILECRCVRRNSRNSNVGSVMIILYSNLVNLFVVGGFISCK